MPNWGGAASGAAGGAAVGSVAGPWGAAIGAGVGGLMGLFGGNDPAPPPTQNPVAQQALGNIVQNAGSRAAPQISGAQFGVDPTGRQGLLDTASRLGGIASGQQMGAGELAVNRQLGQATAQQMAAARMAQGANAALALRNAMRGNAELQLQGAGQAAQSRMQDQTAANQQLGQLYGGLYGQDAQVAAQNAQLGQQAMLANQQAQLQQQGMNDALQIQALGQMLGWSQDQINAYMAQTQKMQAQNAAPNIGASLLQGGGALLAMKGMLGGQQPPPNNPQLPNPGGLAQMYPHGDQASGPVTMPS